MRYQAVGVIFALMLAAACTAGCSGGSGEEKVEVTIREEQAHLETWQEKLEQNTTDQAVLSESIRGMSVQKDGKEDGQGHYYVAIDGNEQVYLARKDIVDQIL